MNKTVTTLTLLLASFLAFSQDKTDWIGNTPEGCTSVTVGKKASFDGSVMTSHTDDSHRTRSWMDIQPAKKYKKGDVATMYKREADNTKAMPIYKHTPTGSIPQVASTFRYVNTAYPCMNQKQLAIGESTIGGREQLQSDNGLIDCQRLCQLMLERCSTARQAIKMAGELTKKYGWIDAGECLTIADPNEVWHFEIYGAGKGKKGSLWIAQRVPDDHVAVNANASTIKEIDLKNKDYFMASDNIYSIAEQNGWWKKGEHFRFNSVYAPHSRQSVASRRREWQVFNILAPSLKLDPNDKDYPFSVKPDNKVTLDDMVKIFSDYYEGTPYDMTRTITTNDKDGKVKVSPMANPFMPYEQLELNGVNGGWFMTDHETGKITFLGERTIARWYTMYGTIIQCRSWLPNDIGGIVWLAQDNIATSIYIPVYAGTTDLPKSYKTPGRENGFTRESAWWAFNRMSSLTAQRWGEARHDVYKVFRPMQKEMFDNQKNIDEEAKKIKSPEKRSEFLTKQTKTWGDKVVKSAWKLGDDFWTKYDEKF